MTLTVRFFASFKTLVNCETMLIDSNFQPLTVAGLKTHLGKHNPVFKDFFQNTPNVCVAVNQTMATENSAIEEKCEVAFFPPVSGG